VFEISEITAQAERLYREFKSHIARDRRKVLV
jgi:hypothetical protein